MYETTVILWRRTLPTADPDLVKLRHARLDVKPTHGYQV